MAPQRTRKQKSTDSATSQQAMPRHAKAGNPARTPERSPIRKRPTITQAQKQALIDNLQLEITDRARKLRAQYGLLAQGLRSRLEMRVNRIPQALRGANIMDLINKYSEQVIAHKLSVPVTANPTTTATHSTVSRTKAVTASMPSPARSKGTKRTSADMTTASDKENVEAELLVSKKRAKADPAESAAHPEGKARSTRTASRKIHPSQVLSPKSNNSRTFPRSPLKPSGMSPHKTQLARPVSPMKPPPVPTASIARMTASKGKAPSRAASRQVGPMATTTAGAGRGRRVLTAQQAVPPAREGRGRASASSSASDSSAGTTIVTKKKKTATTLTKKAVAAAKSTAASAAKRATAKKEATPASTATGGRVLRARR